MENNASSVVSHGSSYEPESDRRLSPRKRLQRRAVMVTSQHETLITKTIEISDTGISVMAPKPLPKGLEGTLRFDFFFNGHDALVNGAFKVMNCSCSGLDGFRIGMTFAISNQDGKQLIAEFLS